MYRDFLRSYQPVVSITQEGDNSLGVFSNSQVNDLFLECGGCVFRKGVYKTHTHASSFYWTSAIVQLFQDYQNRIIPFGFDWMGRQFAVDIRDKNKLFMFDPATVETFELQQDLYSFHNCELVDDGDSYLDESKLKRVLSKLSRSEIGYAECIGYKVPLFLNGKDDLGNLEIGDTEVYWSFQSQIYHQVKNLPPGTKINSIKFE